MAENITALQSSAQIADCKEVKKYIVKKRDTLWGVAKNNLKENGQKPTNKKIVGEMNRLAQLNGAEDFQKLSKKFWKPGPGFEMLVEDGCKTNTGAKAPKGKVSVEEVKTPAKTVTAPKAETTPKADATPKAAATPAPSQNVQEAPKAPDNAKFPSTVDLGQKTPAAQAETPSKKNPDIDSIKKTIDGEIAKEAPKVEPKAPEAPKADATPGPSQNVQEAPKAPESLKTSESPFSVKTGYQTPAAQAETPSKKNPDIDSIKKTIDGEIAKEAPKVEPKAPEAPKADAAPKEPLKPILTDALKGKFLDGTAKAPATNDPKLPDVTDGLFAKKPVQEAQPLLPKAKPSTLTEEAKARIRAGFANSSEIKLPETGSGVTDALQGIQLKKGDAKPETPAQTPVVPKAVAKPETSVPAPVTPKAVAKPETSVPAPATPKADAAPETSVPAPVTPKADAAPETAPQEKVLTEQEKAEIRHLKEAADAAAAKAQAAAAAAKAKEAEKAETEKLLAEIAKRNAEEEAKAKLQQTPTAEAPKKLTRPQDAKFGDKEFWSTDDKIYQTPDGNSYGKIISGGDNLYYNRAKNIFVKKEDDIISNVLSVFGRTRKIVPVDVSELPPEKIHLIADEAEKVRQ